jgi:hypothetical protein
MFMGILFIEDYVLMIIMLEEEYIDILLVNFLCFWI